MCSSLTTFFRPNSKLEVFVLRKLALLAVATVGVSVGSVAHAEGFSMTLDVPIAPEFSIGLGLNYSLQVIPNLYVGISTDTRFIAGNPSATPATNGTFSFKARFGGKYIETLLLEKAYYLKWYAGAGIVIQPFGPTTGFSSDLVGGFFGRYEISRVAKVYGGLDGGVLLEFNQANPLNLFASLFAGIKIDPNPLLSLYFQTSVGWNRIENTENTLVGGYLLDARIGTYFSIVPQFRLGIFVGYISSQAKGGSLTFGITGQFAEKPGSLATPGNYLP
jgi:hypothetical protein